MGLVSSSSSTLQSYHSLVGLACTSSLVSSVTSGRPNRISRGHVIATMADGNQWGYDVSLSLSPVATSSSSSSVSSETSSSRAQLQRQRSRIEEDSVFSQLVLQTLLDHLQPDEELLQTDGWLQQYRNGGDGIVKFQKSLTQGTTGGDNDDCAVLMGSHRILNKEASVALLLPTPSNEEGGEGSSSSFTLISRPVLPRRTLVFPGSFNPPHEGHLALAQAAVQAMKKSNSKDYDNDQDFSVLFEMSLTNADKPAMDPHVASERLQTFFKLDNDSMPNDWGVLLTSAPLFSEKVNAIRCEGNTNNNNELVFIIGTDTLVRIINPKYYGNSQENMLEAIRDMGRQGVRFVAGGRLEQQPDGKGDVFVTGEEDLKQMPQDIQDMFILIREEDFRVDISSTELRRQKQQQEQGE
mmetsp:Transcript_15990/g.22541  ORF Transcript_15990/g.22541 Transcript_15990/m.22541 type:complete len:410 (-) Transcript_15990:251-1480(-)